MNYSEIINGGLTGVKTPRRAYGSVGAPCKAGQTEVSSGRIAGLPVHGRFDDGKPEPVLVTHNGKAHHWQ